MLVLTAQLWMVVAGAQVLLSLGQHLWKRFLSIVSGPFRVLHTLQVRLRISLDLTHYVSPVSLLVVL